MLYTQGFLNMKAFIAKKIKNKTINIQWLYEEKNKKT